MGWLVGGGEVSTSRLERGRGDDILNRGKNSPSAMLKCSLYESISIYIYNCNHVWWKHLPGEEWVVLPPIPPQPLALPSYFRLLCWWWWPTDRWKLQGMVENYDRWQTNHTLMSFQAEFELRSNLSYLWLGYRFLWGTISATHTRTPGQPMIFTHRFLIPVAFPTWTQPPLPTTSANQQKFNLKPSPPPNLMEIGTREKASSMSVKHSSISLRVCYGLRRQY